MKKGISKRGYDNNVFEKSDFFRPLETCKFEELEEILNNIQICDFGKYEGKIIIINEEDYHYINDIIIKTKNYDIDKLKHQLNVLMYGKEGYISARKASIFAAYLDLTETYIFFKNSSKLGANLNFEMDLYVRDAETKESKHRVSRIILY